MDDLQEDYKIQNTKYFFKSLISLLLSHLNSGFNKLKVNDSTYIRC